MNKIFESSLEIVREYLNLVNTFPEEVFQDGEIVDVFEALLGQKNDENELSDSQLEIKQREEKIGKKIRVFSERFSRDEVVLLYNAYEFGKYLYSNSEDYIVEQYEKTGGKEEYFKVFYDSVVKETQNMSKSDLFYELTGKQDRIVKKSLNKYLQEF